MRLARFNRLPRALNRVDYALDALQDWRGRLGFFRRLECGLPGLVQLIQPPELLFQSCRVLRQFASGYQQTNVKSSPVKLEPVKHVEGRAGRQKPSVLSETCVDFTCQVRDSVGDRVRT